MTSERFTSRKFIVVMSCIAAASGLAAYGKMTGDVATVLLACVVSYNMANAYVEGKGAEK